LLEWLCIRAGEYLDQASALEIAQSPRNCGQFPDMPLHNYTIIVF
jgi:hypothetical protein